MIDRFKCRFDNLIGKPFGYKYEIVNQEFELKFDDTESDDTEKATNNNEGITANKKFLTFLFLLFYLPFKSVIQLMIVRTTGICWMYPKIKS